MAMLKDLVFSDLVLTASDSFLKGTEDSRVALSRPDADVLAELQQLRLHVDNVFKNYDPSYTRSLRIVHEGLTFRASCYFDVLQGHVFFLRRQAERIPCLREISFPAYISEWLLADDISKGFVLFSGAQACGKTTSAASYIAERLTTHGGHAVTYEHPIELPLAGPHGSAGYCFQTEIASEAELAGHIERSHRYSSPNIIFIGEIRTKHAASEALRVALGSSQQIVVATIHGITGTAALERMLAFATEIDGQAAYHNLAQTLTALIHQRLEFDQVQKKHLLNIPEFLLLPFNSPRADQVRTKIRTAKEGQLFLDDNFREIRNRIKLGEQL